jgi:predicted RNA binding protein YcfA (HicA-like mRNA interferase family)
MSKLEKLIQKIFARQQVSYNDAEKILLGLGYELKTRGSHHVFRKDGCRHVTIKNRPQLLQYQLKDLEEALKDHGYEKTI